MNAKCRHAAVAVTLAGSVIALSGCMSSPTYGTDKTQVEQLKDDFSGMLSLKPKSKVVADYKPRPELVRPSSLAALPAPQERIANASNPAWPEAPEARRARIRAEATENRENPFYEPVVINDISGETQKPVRLDDEDPQDVAARPMSAREARQFGEEVRRRKLENAGGTATTRKYLSEPPVAYRQPAPTAASDDLGEDEDKKARRIKRAATKKEGGLRGLWPW